VQKKAAACAGVFGSSGRASRESIDKGKALCRKLSSWIGGVLLTRTRPTMRVDLVNKQVTLTWGRMEGRGTPRADDLAESPCGTIGQGMDRVEWIMPVIAFPAEPFNWSVSVGDELD
jgi:hypothetical protein